MNEETNPQNIMLPTAVGGMRARNDPSGGEPVTGCGTPRRSTEQPAAFISPGYSQTTTTTQILHPTMFARAATRAWTAPASRAFSASAANFTKVAVLGAGGGIGQPLSLLLKSDPLVTVPSPPTIFYRFSRSLTCRRQRPRVKVRYQTRTSLLSTSIAFHCLVALIQWTLSTYILPTVLCST